MTAVCLVISANLDLWWFPIVLPQLSYSDISQNLLPFMVLDYNWSEEKFAAATPLWSSWLYAVKDRRCWKVPVYSYSLLLCMQLCFLTAGPAEPQPYHARPTTIYIQTHLL